MAMKSRKQYGGVAHVGNGGLYPSISPAYWSPQPQSAPYAVPGNIYFSFQHQPCIFFSPASLRCSKGIS